MAASMLGPGTGVTGTAGGAAGPPARARNRATSIRRPYNERTCNWEEREGKPNLSYLTIPATLEIQPETNRSTHWMTTHQTTVQRAVEGDERALRQLWMENAPHIDAVVLRLCGDRDLAADVAQEVWIQIFRALPSYRGDSQFGTWAHRIAVNRTLNALRKVRRIAKVEIDVEDDTAAAPDNPEAETERGIVAESIDQAVRQLSPGARTVFLLHDVEGYTHEEIAQELGITTGGSKSQLFKARAKLRRLLAHLSEGFSTGVGQEHGTSI
jgi:RNA polymerase sigma-70 factor (ECF subfamily)